MILLYALITGILFGMLLQKGEVVHYEKQIGALRLLDMTIFKFMLTAIAVGMVGFYLLHDLQGLVLPTRTISLGNNIIGGLIFGIGWAIFGYCPGTSWGAIGEGRFGVLVGTLGMISGGIFYGEIYPLISSTISTWGVYGQISLPQLMGVSHWIIIPLFILGLGFLFRWFEKKGL